MDELTHDEDWDPEDLLERIKAYEEMKVMLLQELTSEKEDHRIARDQLAEERRHNEQNMATIKALQEQLVAKQNALEETQKLLLQSQKKLMEERKRNRSRSPIRGDNNSPRSLSPSPRPAESVSVGTQTQGEEQNLAVVEQQKALLETNQQLREQLAEATKQIDFLSTQLDEERFNLDLANLSIENLQRHLKRAGVTLEDELFEEESAQPAESATAGSSMAPERASPKTADADASLREVLSKVQEETKQLKQDLEIAWQTVRTLQSQKPTHESQSKPPSSPSVVSEDETSARDELASVKSNYAKLESRWRQATQENASLHQTAAEYQGTIARLTKQLEHAIAANAQLEQRIQALSTELQHWKRARELLDSGNAEVDAEAAREQVALMKKYCQDARQVLEETQAHHEQQKSALEAKILALEEENRQVASTFQQQKESLESYSKLLSIKQSEIDELHHKLRAAEAVAASANTDEDSAAAAASAATAAIAAEMTARDHEIEQLKQRLETERTRVQDLRRQLVQTEARESELAAELTMVKAELLAAKEQLISAGSSSHSADEAASIRETQAEVTKALVEMDEAQAEVERAVADINSLEEQLKKSQQERDTIATQLADAMRQLSQTSEELDESRQRINEQEEELATLRRNIEGAREARRELSEVKLLLKEAELRERALRESIESERSRADERQKELDVARSIITSVHAEKEQLSDAVAELTAKIQRDTDRIAAEMVQTAEQLHAALQRARESEEEAIQLRAKVEELCGAKQELEIELAELRNELQRATAATKRLQHEIEEHKSRYDAQQQELQSEKAKQITAVSLQEEQDKLRRELQSAFDTARAELEQQLAAERAKVHSAERQFGELRRDLDAEKTALERERGQREQMAAMLEAVTGERERLKLELGVVRNKLLATEAQLAERQKLLAEASQRNTELATAVSEQRGTEAAALSEKLALSKQKRDKLKQDLQRFKEEFDRNAAQLEEERRQLTAHSAELEQAIQRLRIEREQQERQWHATQRKHEEELKALQAQVAAGLSANVKAQRVLAQLAIDLDEQHAERIVLERQVLELAERLRAAEAKEARLSEQLEHGRHERAQLFAQLQDLHDLLRTSTSDVAVLEELRDQHQHLLAKASAAEQIAAELHMKLAEAETAVRQLREDEADETSMVPDHAVLLQEALAASEKRAEDLENTVKGLQERLQLANNELSEVRAIAEKSKMELESAADQAESRIAELEAALQAASLEKQSLLDELQDRTGRLDATLEQLAVAQKQHSTAAALADQLKGDNEWLRAQAEELTAQLHNATSQYADAQRQLERVATERKQLEETFHASEENHKRAFDELRRAANEERATILARAAEERESALRPLQEAVDAARAEMEEMRQRLVDANARQHDAEERHQRELEGVRKVLADVEERLQRELEAAQQEQQRCAAHAREVEAALEAKASECAAMAKEAEQMTREAAELRVEIEALKHLEEASEQYQQQLDQLEARCRHADAELTDLKGRLALKSDECESLRSELARFQEKLAEQLNRAVTAESNAAQAAEQAAALTNLVAELRGQILTRDEGIDMLRRELCTAREQAAQERTAAEALRSQLEQVQHTAASQTVAVRQLTDMNEETLSLLEAEKSARAVDKARLEAAEAELATAKKAQQEAEQKLHGYGRLELDLEATKQLLADTQMRLSMRTAEYTEAVAAARAAQSEATAAQEAKRALEERVALLEEEVHKTHLAAANALASPRPVAEKRARPRMPLLANALADEHSLSATATPPNTPKKLPLEEVGDAAVPAAASPLTHLTKTRPMGNAARRLPSPRRRDGEEKAEQSEQDEAVVYDDSFDQAEQEKEEHDISVTFAGVRTTLAALGAQSRTLSLGDPSRRANVEVLLKRLDESLDNLERHVGVLEDELAAERLANSHSRQLLEQSKIFSELSAIDAQLSGLRNTSVSISSPPVSPIKSPGEMRPTLPPGTEQLFEQTRQMVSKLSSKAKKPSDRDLAALQLLNDEIRSLQSQIQELQLTASGEPAAANGHSFSHNVSAEEHNGTVGPLELSSRIKAAESHHLAALIALDKEAHAIERLAKKLDAMAAAVAALRGDQNGPSAALRE